MISDIADSVALNKQDEAAAKPLDVNCPATND
jgi:hypothetical protein